MTVAQRLKHFVQLLDRRVPDKVSRLSGPWLQVFRAFWIGMYVLAVAGTIGGLWVQFNSSAEEITSHSALILGSRAGFAVSPADGTLVRFPVGPPEKAAGFVSGDKIISIYGLPLPRTMPITEKTLTAHVNDPTYIAMGNLLFGVDQGPVPLEVRGPGGRVRNLTVTTGDYHIDAAARSLGISPQLLSLIDLSNLLVYPLLLWIAFSLYTRNSNQPVPALLSASILLQICAEQPSGGFLMNLGTPRAILVATYDISNIMLCATLMLFPDGRLRPRAIFIPLCLLPVLLFLQGKSYQWTFLFGLAAALLIFIKRLPSATGVTKQQFWLLLAGLAIYPALRALSVWFDHLTWNATSLSQQLLVESGAGVAFALAPVPLFLVLFSALRRHRLYDADALFPRSVMIGGLTLIIGAFFAAASASLQLAADAMDRNAGPWPSLIAAAAAVLLINPVQRRIHGATERLLQKKLFAFRTQLPKRMDDLRETESPDRVLRRAVSDIVQGLGATGSAAIINGRVLASVGTDSKTVRRWLRSTQMPDPPRLSCDRDDRLFPVRLPLRTATHPVSLIGWLVLGPRHDGSIYSREERQALMDVEESVSRALEVARQRQQGQLAERRWKERQEDRVAALEEQIASIVEMTAPWKKLPA